MSLTVPLQVDSRTDLEELKCDIAAAFGDSIHGRKREVNVTMPSEVCQNKALSRSAGGHDRVGPVTLFKNGSPFAIVHFRVDRETNEYSYSLGGHANWQRRGSEEMMKKYFEAVENTLDHLGVLPDHYHVSCPCGAEEVVDGTYTAVAEFFTDHNSSGEHEGRRVSTATLVGREVSICSETEQNTKRRQEPSVHP
jgi:hypothetical protein